MTNVIHHNFRPRRPVCLLDKALARLRRTELAMEAAAAEIEAVARRIAIQADQRREISVRGVAPKVKE